MGFGMIALPAIQILTQLWDNYQNQQINQRNAAAREEAGNLWDQTYLPQIQNFQFRDPNQAATDSTNALFGGIGVDTGAGAADPLSQLLDKGGYGGFGEDIRGLNARIFERGGDIVDPLSYGIDALGLPDPYQGASAIRGQAVAGAANQAQDSLNAAGQFSGALRTGGDPFSSGLFNEAQSGIQQQRRNTLTGAEAGIQQNAQQVQGQNAIARQNQFAMNRQENASINAAIDSLRNDKINARGLQSNVFSNATNQISSIGAQGQQFGQNQQQIDIAQLGQLLMEAQLGLQRANFGLEGTEILNRYADLLPGALSTAPGFGDLGYEPDSRLYFNPNQQYQQ